MSETFGEMLARLRQQRRQPRPRAPGRVQVYTVSPTSQNQLARDAGLDAAAINRLERGAFRPRRATAEALAAALNLTGPERDRLLIAAGYWPWNGRVPRHAADLLAQLREDA